MAERTCRRCGLERQVPEEIAGNHHVCRACALEHRRAYNRVWNLTHRETVRAAQREWARRNREYQREASARWYRAMRESPEAHAHYLETQRMSARLRAEREGRALPPVPEARYQAPYYKWTLPAEPLRDVVVEQEALIGREALARAAGVPARLLYRLVDEAAPTISVIAADKLALAVGLHLDLLYGQEAS